MRNPNLPVAPWLMGTLVSVFLMGAAAWIAGAFILLRQC